jgi:DNA polymerase III epsilon subunit-like protein
MVDVEADGPIPGDYSMVSLGAVVVEPSLRKTFYATLRPISNRWDEAALRVCGFSRDETMSFSDPQEVIREFSRWVSRQSSNPFFISDNNGFDWAFVNWYLLHFTGENPFGFSSSNLVDIYCGLKRDLDAILKKSAPPPRHNALDDALANAKRFLALAQDYGITLDH